MNSDEETIKYLKERGLLEQIGNIMDSSYNDSLKDDGLDKDEAINQRVEKELNRLRDRTKAYENGEINARDLSLKEQLYRSGDSALIKLLERLAAENDIDF